MIDVKDKVQYQNVLGNWEDGVVEKVNKLTYRILNTSNFKIVSMPHKKVRLLD